MSLMLLLGKDPTSCPHSRLFVVVVVVVVEVVVGAGSMHSAVH